MSRPMNMLRTRRKDCNVKPNRRLDRKSSRGMIYENEELRLKTININAEVESRVSDIKKLKKENDMLKKDLWYLRDEYDKLEKLIKDKKLDFSSSSTTGSTSSDSESYSSYSEEGEEVETTQNMKNVQKTNLKNLQDQFDHLSVVTEETSAAENSEHHSNKDTWECEDILKPDQSYPQFRTLAKSPTLPMADNIPINFFSPIKAPKEYEENQENRNGVLYPGEFYTNQHFMGNIMEENMINDENFVSQKVVKTNATNFYQNMVLVPKRVAGNEIEVQGMEKAATDLIVKIDNQNFSDKTLVFSNTPSQSTFSNGGNLEELLNDIESVSQKAAHAQCGYYSQDGVPAEQDDKAFKSELNVVLVPNPMPLIGLDKYKNVQRSFENLPTNTPENFSPQIPTLQHPTLPMEENQIFTTNILGTTAIPEITPNSEANVNPFFFGNFKDNYVNADHFSMRYNPLVYKNDENQVTSNKNQRSCLENRVRDENTQTSGSEKLPRSGSKTNLLELTSSDHVSSENEDTTKAKSSKLDKPGDPPDQKSEKPDTKSPKLSIRKKVSIHFRGKKDKPKLSDCSTPKTPTERRGSIFDARFAEKDKRGSLFDAKDKSKMLHQKTPSLETQKSNIEGVGEPKTPSSSDSKTSNEKKSDKRESMSEKKSRKSVSVSPDRKHVHVKEDGQSPKKHRKHKKSDKSRQRKQSVIDTSRMFRERSFSICTDRSNILEHRLGLTPGFGSNLYFDDYSDRERTNSISSCDTAENRRKLSTIPNMALTGKVPWCGCWGNGCL